MAEKSADHSCFLFFPGNGNKICSIIVVRPIRERKGRRMSDSTDWIPPFLLRLWAHSSSSSLLPFRRSHKGFNESRSPQKREQKGGKKQPLNRDHIPSNAEQGGIGERNSPPSSLPASLFRGEGRNPLFLLLLRPPLLESLCQRDWQRGGRAGRHPVCLVSSSLSQQRFPFPW